jgi:hypothetical protein
MKKGLIVIILMAISVTTASVTGAFVSKKRTLNNKIDIQYPNRKPTQPLQDPNSDDFWFVTTVHDSVRFFEAPRSDAKSVLKTDQWLNVYVVGDKIADYFLIMTVDSDDNIVGYRGWVHRNDLQWTYGAQKNKNNIYRKALVINHWRKIVPGKVQDLQQASVWNGLHDDRQEVKKLSLFEIYFIFQEQRDEQGNEYYLIGQDPVIINFYDASKVIVGWLPKDRALNWDTRQAVYFNKANLSNRISSGNLGVIFQSKGDDYRDLKSWHLGGNRPNGLEEGAPMAIESEEVKTDLPYDWSRFPILGEPDTIEGVGRVFRIGYVGDTITRSGRVLPWHETESEIEKLRRLKETVKNIDIHFVLDTTLTMGPAFGTVRKTIEETIHLVNSRYDKIGVRFGLLMYKDFNDELTTDSYLYNRFEPQEDPKSILTALANEEPKGGGSDEAEAGLFAIRKSIELGMPKPSSLNVLFLLTDAISKDAPDPDQDIVDTLYASSMLFFPVIQDKSQRAIGQMEEIVAEYNQRFEGVPGSVILADFEGVSAAQQMVDKITETFEDIYTLATLVEKAISGDVIYRDGAYVIGEKSFGVRLSARFAFLMEKAGINLSLFDKMVQIFEEGYVLDIPPDKGPYRLTGGSFETLVERGVQASVVEKLRQKFTEKLYSEAEFRTRYFEKNLNDLERRQFESAILSVANTSKPLEYYVLVDKTTLYSLEGLLQRMVTRPIRKDNIKNIWGRQVQIETHDGQIKMVGRDEETIAELIEKHTGLPVNEEILRLTLDDISKLSNKEIRALYERLKVKKDQISDIISEHDVRYMVVDGEVKRKLEGLTPYFWRTGSGDIDFCWIKRTILP